MIVKKYKLNAQTQAYDFIKGIPADEETVIAKMAIDMPTPMEEKPTYIYEAGHIEDLKFVDKYVWTSENPNLFD